MAKKKRDTKNKVPLAASSSECKKDEADEYKEWFEKELRFYQCSVSAWYETNRKRDSTIGALAAAAIGGLVYRMDKVLEVSNPGSVVFGFSLASISFFVITVALTIIIYKKDASLISSLMSDEEDHGKQEFQLRRIDNALLICFGTAILCSVVAIGLDYKGKWEINSRSQTPAIANVIEKNNGQAEVPASKEATLNRWNCAVMKWNDFDRSEVGK
jgi:hypothetical protein